MNNSKDKARIIYIFKSYSLYGYIDENLDLYLYNPDNSVILANENWGELLDILPEGIDLEIMFNSFNLSNPKELFAYLKNPIGDYYFSTNRELKQEKIISSNLDTSELSFPKILNCKIDIEEAALYPKAQTNAKLGEIQRLSLSGYQHKLQVSIIDKVIKQNYGDFILKPTNEDYDYLAINEHLHTSFMKEWGFAVPFNALVYDEKFKAYYYLIKRFDVLPNGDKLPQISLNALIKSKNKYEGSWEKVCELLSETKIDLEQRLNFIKYIYANVLLFNNDLHKKNISFVLRNNKLILSPAYDIINTHIVKGLGKKQVALPINNRDERIKIFDLERSISILDLNVENTKQELEAMFAIYQKKYPVYIEAVKKLRFFDDKNRYVNRMLEPYRKNLKLFEVYLSKKG